MAHADDYYWRNGGWVRYPQRADDEEECDEEVVAEPKEGKSIIELYRDVTNPWRR